MAGLLFCQGDDSGSEAAYGEKEPLVLSCIFWGRRWLEEANDLLFGESALLHIHHSPG